MLDGGDGFYPLTTFSVLSLILANYLGLEHFDLKELEVTAILKLTENQRLLCFSFWQPVYGAASFIGKINLLIQPQRAGYR